jgi:uncharacterized protein (TIGR02246 family)
MYGRIARRMMRRAVDRLNAGDIEPTMRSYADDAVLVFPGDHSWAGRYAGREAIEGFYRRAVETGLRFELGEVAVKGPPWNTAVWFRLRDRAVDEAGDEIYANRAMEFARSRWGRIVYQEIYLDTQRVAELDRRLGAVARRSDRR